jgi:hypothetical protein
VRVHVRMRVCVCVCVCACVCVYVCVRIKNVNLSAMSYELNSSTSHTWNTLRKSPVELDTFRAASSRAWLWNTGQGKLASLEDRMEST